MKKTLLSGETKYTSKFSRMLTRRIQRSFREVSFMSFLKPAPYYSGIIHLHLNYHTTIPRRKMLIVFKKINNLWSVGSLFHAGRNLILTKREAKGNENYEFHLGRSSQNRNSKHELLLLHHWTVSHLILLGASLWNTW